MPYLKLKSIMTKPTLLTITMFVLSVFYCNADNTTSLFEPIFEDYNEKVNGNKIRGQKLKGKYDGIAVIKFKNGDIYYGDVQNGRPQGKGVYICKDGNSIKNCDESIVYIGRFKAGLKQKGVCLNNESDVLYEGLFTNDSPDNAYPAKEDTEYTGYFDVINYNDWIYIGEITQGIPNGMGIIIFNNKDFLISNYIEGSRSGIGLFVTSNGEWQTEKAKNGDITVISSSSYYANIDAERNRQTKAHLAEALGYFSQALNSVNDIVTIASGHSQATGNEVADYTGNSSAVSSSSNSRNYQAEYDKWAQRAESHYNSITNLGYSAKNKNGDTHGSAGQGMSGGNYVSMKKSFREAQKQMRSIRTKASKEGVSIAKSQWETATISY